MIRTLIAIPSIGTTDIRFAVSLGNLWKPKGTDIGASPRAMPDAARNALFDQAAKLRYDYVFFLDDDMVLDIGCLDKLVQLLESDESIAAAAPLAFRRHAPFYPCVMNREADGAYTPIRDVTGSLGRVEVDAIHFAATLVRTSWLIKVAAPRFEFSKNGEAVKGEDLVLSEKLKALGGKLVCDTSIPEAAHIGIPPLITRRNYEAVRAQSAQSPGKIVVP